MYSSGLDVPDAVPRSSASASIIVYDRFVACSKADGDSSNHFVKSSWTFAMGPTALALISRVVGRSLRPPSLPRSTGAGAATTVATTGTTGNSGTGGRVFPVDARRVRVLSSPPAFLDALLAAADASQRRISIASLYLGNGDRERDLVAALCRARDRIDGEALAQAQAADGRGEATATATATTATATAPATAAPDTGVRVLLDYHRAQRQVPAQGGDRGKDAPRESSLTLLGPLLATPAPASTTPTTASAASSAASDSPDNPARRAAAIPTPPQLALFKCPPAGPVSGAIARWGGSVGLGLLVEAMGVQHLKVYAFDDTLIMSGANLETEYFTVRQDRYVVVEDKALAALYHDAVALVAKHSHHVVFTSTDNNGNTSGNTSGNTTAGNNTGGNNTGGTTGNDATFRGYLPSQFTVSPSSEIPVERVGDALSVLFQHGGESGESEEAEEAEAEEEGEEEGEEGGDEEKGGLTLVTAVAQL